MLAPRRSSRVVLDVGVVWYHMLAPRKSFTRCKSSVVPRVGTKQGFELEVGGTQVWQSMLSKSGLEKLNLARHYEKSRNGKKL